MPLIFFKAPFSYRIVLTFGRMCSRFFTLLLSVSAAATLTAQPVHLPYRHFTILDGLAQQQITCLMQDSRGYIWAGTKAGLSKFDGERFENFHIRDGLPGIHLNQLFEDGEGNVWAFADANVGFFDGARWRTVLRRKLHLQGYRLGGAIFGWEPDSMRIWRMDKDTARVLRVFDEASLRAATQQANDLPGAWVNIRLHGELYFIKLDAEGRISNFQRRDSPFTYFQPAQLGHRYLYMTGPDRSRCCFIRQLEHETPLDSLRFPATFSLKQVLWWMYAKNGDAYFVGDNTLYHKPFGHIDAIPLNIPIQSPSKIIEDAEGAIWIASEAGLFQYFPNGFSYISEKDAPLTWNMVEDDKGHWWFGSFGQGLRRFDGQRFEQVRLPQHLLLKKEQVLNFYFGASKDHLGNLYFSTDLGLIALKNGRLVNLNKQHRLDDCFGSAVLFNLFDPIERKVLFGMQTGVVAYDPEKDKMQGLYSGDCDRCFVLGIARDSLQHYWFSSGGWTVRYHIPTKSVKIFRKKEGKVPFRGAYCIEADAGGGVWFGSVEEGLFYYDAQKEDFRRVGANILTREVYNLKIVDSILMVGEGSGLFALDLKTFHTNGKERIKAYNHRNGFLGTEPNQNGALFDSKKGNYWVIASNQVAFIHKSKLNFKGHPTKVRIFQINQHRIPYLTNGEKLLLTDTNEVKIRFESIGFQRPLRTQYSWRLIGHQERWSNWTEDPIAFFSQLPSGDYTFEVRSRHPGSEDSTAFVTDTFAFRVDIPFFKEPYFILYAFLTVGALLLLGLAGFLFYRKAKQEARVAQEAATGQERLAQLYQIQTLEAEKIAGERERLMQYYQIQTLQAQLKPHFIFNLLNSIKKSVVQGDQDEADRKIDHLSQLLRKTLESSVGANPENIGVDDQRISLQSEIELLRYYIELMAAVKKGKFTWSIEIDGNLNPSGIAITPMIVQPFVENAIRHGLLTESPQRGDGHLLVRFSKEKNGLLCTVSDGGVGVQATLKHQQENGKANKSLGIKLVKDRIRLLKEFGIHIELDIRDNPRGGTLVNILFKEKNQLHENHPR